MAKTGRFLQGSKKIMEYLQVSKPVFYKFVSMGMPAVVIDNRWYAHADNLDEFMKAITRNRTSVIPEDAE